MKLTVKKSGETVKGIIMELTPAEALIINHAMRRYTEDEGVNEQNREEIHNMLFVEPRFIESKDGVKTELANALDKIRAEIEQAYCKVIDDYDAGRNYGLYMATQIIDKYISGKENEE